MLVGDEPFRDGEVDLPFTVSDFWRWGVANLTGNALRGIVAEFLVARALSVASGTRVEWDAVDLRTPEGITVEVKCSGYVQTWAQKTLSRPSFDIAAKRGWDATTNTYAPSPLRSADVYVFALHHHRERATAEPRDVSQWSFYVVATRTLDEQHPKAVTVSLPQLEKLTQPVRYREVARAISEALQGNQGAA